jgi:hypothetical protein
MSKNFYMNLYKLPCFFQTARFGLYNSHMGVVSYFKQTINVKPIYAPWTPLSKSI